MADNFYQRFLRKQDYQLRADATRIKTIDMHTGGEPLRVVVAGYPEIAANSLLEYRRILKTQHDHLRTALMFEPRGHADMYGCLVLPPFHPEADCSVIFMHNEGYSTMCGHAVIAIMTLATEMGWVEVVDGHAKLNIEAPCGLIKAVAVVVDGNISASFDCVPSFVAELDAMVFIESLGAELSYDLAYGGAFYAYVDARPLGLELIPANLRRLIDLGSEIKHAVSATNHNIVHPFETDLGFLYGTVFIGDTVSSGVDSRNVCVFADGEVDRSPTGSGVSGRMAIHFQRSELRQGQRLLVESIVASVFAASIIKTLDYGPYKAVIPRIEGSASVVGSNQWIVNANDDFAHGFLLR
ncbi:MAG: proline racemase family protein [Pseudomonadales bacterium]